MGGELGKLSREATTGARYQLQRHAHLVHEVLDVVVGQLLSRVDDAMQVRLHQLADDVHVLELSERRRHAQILDADQLWHTQQTGGRQRGDVSADKVVRGEAK
jgi:hypothetical protein